MSINQELFCGRTTGAFSHPNESGVGFLLSLREIYRTYALNRLIMKLNLILQLKNRVFDVKRDIRGRITLTEGNGVVCEETAAIIAQNGGVKGLLLQCYETTETIDEILAKRKQVKEMQKSRILEDTEIVERDGLKMNLGRRKCARVGDLFYLQDNIRKTWSVISLERFLQFQREYNDFLSEQHGEAPAYRLRPKKQ